MSLERSFECRDDVLPECVDDADASLWCAVLLLLLFCCFGEPWWKMAFLWCPQRRGLLSKGRTAQRGRSDGWMDGWMDGWVEARPTDGWMDGSTLGVSVPSRRK